MARPKNEDSDKYTAGLSTTVDDATLAKFKILAIVAGKGQNELLRKIVTDYVAENDVSISVNGQALDAS